MQKVHLEYYVLYLSGGKSGSVPSVPIAKFP